MLSRAGRAMEAVLPAHSQHCPAPRLNTQVPVVPWSCVLRLGQDGIGWGWGSQLGVGAAGDGTHSRWPHCVPHSWGGWVQHPWGAGREVMLRGMPSVGPRVPVVTLPSFPPELPPLLTPSAEAQVREGRTPTWSRCSLLVTWPVCHRTPAQGSLGGHRSRLTPCLVVRGSWGAAGG